MQEQSSLIKQRFSELSEEAKTEKHALELGRQIRIHAQGDLQRVASQLFEEMGIRGAALSDQERVHEELTQNKLLLVARSRNFKQLTNKADFFTQNPRSRTRILRSLQPTTMP